MDKEEHVKRAVSRNEQKANDFVKTNEDILHTKQRLRVKPIELCHIQQGVLFR